MQICRQNITLKTKYFALSNLKLRYPEIFQNSNWVISHKACFGNAIRNLRIALTRPIWIGFLLGFIFPWQPLFIYNSIGNVFGQRSSFQWRHLIAFYDHLRFVYLSVFSVFSLITVAFHSYLMYRKVLPTRKETQSNRSLSARLMIFIEIGIVFAWPTHGP